MKIANSLLAAAVGGVLAGVTGCGNDKPANDGSTVQAAETQATPMAKHACKGQNECKGQGGCKTEKNSCKGQNACKGQGGCKTA